MRLLSFAYIAAATGVLVAGCSGPAASPPAVNAQTTRTQTAPTRSASAPTSPTARITSLTAPFKLPARVSRPTVYPLDQGLLVVGGLNVTGGTTRAILSVDLTGATVKRTGALSVPVHDAAGAVVAGRDFLFGGGSTSVSSAVQDVTPGGSPWAVGHLPHPRADLVAVSDSNAGYLLGGYDGVQGSTTILRTRDAKTFTVVGDLPLAVRYPAVAVNGGSIWLFGGEHAGKQVRDVQRIELRTGHGSVVGQLPRPLAHAGAFTLGSTVFVAGGRAGATATDTVMRFDPATLTFLLAGHLPAPRSDFGVAVVSGTAYLVGGENPKPLDTVIEVRGQTGAGK